MVRSRMDRTKRLRVIVEDAKSWTIAVLLFVISGLLLYNNNLENKVWSVTQSKDCSYFNDGSFTCWKVNER